jgi:hypothetical protein
MLPYYLFFILIAIFAAKERVDYKFKLYFYLVGVLLILFTGLRNEVGGDWYNYSSYFYRFFPYMSFKDALTHDDPGFWLLGYYMHQLGLDLYGVNFVIAIIFIIGLYSLLLLQPYSWLGLLAAFPYLIIVVSMGYIRQAAAIGFVMLAISFLSKNKFLQFVIAIILAASFHKTAVFMIGLGIFYANKGKFLKFLAVLFVGYGMWNSFLSQSQANLIKNYVDANMQSSGAYIRVFMNVVAAMIFFYTSEKWKEFFEDYRFWYYVSLASVALFFFVGVASTAVDRMALYFIPLQLVVFSRLPVLLKDQIDPKVTKTLVIFYYFLVFNIWINLASNSFFWLPYKFIIDFTQFF